MKRILIIGCGDIALRIAALLCSRYRLFGLVRNPDRFEALRAAGMVPLWGDLDEPRSLHQLRGLAHIVLHLAPPPGEGERDTRTKHLLAALSQACPEHGRRRRLPQRVVYISTSGVYGDCGGEVVSETRPTRAQNARAKRRVDAEKQIRHWAMNNGVHASILRVPGIYAADRLPLQRLQQGTPAIVAAEDGYTNHIHADDLARCVIAAMQRAKPNRVYHTTDDLHLKMGDYFDAVADTFNLPHPPRVTRAEAQSVLSPMLLSFMNESRRLSNTRMKNELRVVLRYPAVVDALAEIRRDKIG